MRSGRLALRPAEDRSRIARQLSRLRTTLAEGESPWTPLILLGLDYGIWISAFLVVLAVAELAYYFG